MRDFIRNNIGYFAMLMAVIGFGSGPPFVTLALKEFFYNRSISCKIFNRICTYAFILYFDEG